MNDAKTSNVVYHDGTLEKKVKKSLDGRSKFSSMTTWGPSRRKKKRTKVGKEVGR